MHCHKTSLQLGSLVTIQVSTGVQQIFDQICSLETFRDSQFGEVVALTTLNRIETLESNELAKSDCVYCVYFGKD